METDQHSTSLTNERFVQLILENVADGVFTVNSRFEITFFNPAAERITGVTREQAIGKLCHEVFRTPICGGMCPLRQSLRSGRTIKNFEIDITTANGERQTISVSTAPMVDHDGTFMGGVETFRDLSVIKDLKKEVSGKYTFQDIISKSPKMKQIFQTLPNIAQSDATVLLQGRSGTGKELFATALHNLSPRANGPLVTVNCGALPENLLESELFGFVRGAFTDAKQDRIGRFQAAEGGTIFLDEIGDMPLPLQVKLLRVLEHREYQPLGSDQTAKADVRVVAASNQDLERLVAEGLFREDLYYRLNVVLINIPDLKDRAEDIPLLVDHFVARFRRRSGRTISGLSEPAMAVLLRYPYPGNVRELENAIEHATIIAPGAEIQVNDLPPYMVERRFYTSPANLPASSGLPLLHSEEQERQHLLECLQRNYWNIPRTAKELGVHRSTLWRKVKRLNIQRP